MLLDEVISKIVHEIPRQDLFNELLKFAQWNYERGADDMYLKLNPLGEEPNGK